MATTAAVTRVIEIDVRQSANAQAQVNQMAKNLGSIDETAKKTQASVSGLSGEFGRMASGMLKGVAFAAITTGALAAVAAMRDMVDTTQVLRSRLELVTGSQQKANIAFNDVIQIATRQGQEFGSIGTLYEKIQRNAANLGVTTQGVAAVTEGFAAALRLSGAQTQQADAAILQFSQALASGRLQGDEYRSMTENNAVFMQELGKAAGKTMGELKKMSTDGKIDAAFLREAMFKLGDDGTTMLQRLMDNAAKLPMTFSQARNGVVNELNNLLDALFNTANKSESIFTRMAKVVAQTIGQAAREVRLFAETKAAEEAARSKTAVKETPGMTDRERLNEDLRKRIAESEARELKLTKMFAEGKNEAGQDLTKTQRDRIQEQISVLLNTRKVWKKDLDNDFNEANSRYINKLTNDYKAPTIEDKKKKHPAASARDALYEFQDSLAQKDLNEDYKREGMGPNELKLEEAIGKSKLKGKELEEMVARLRDEAKELDYNIRMLQVDKDLTDRRDSLAKSQAELGQKRLEAMLAKAPAREKKVDPLADFIDQITELDDLIKEVSAGRILGTEEQLKGLQEFRENLDRPVDQMEKLKKAGKSLAEEIRDAMVNSTKEMADAIIDFATGTEKSFGKMLANILKQIASAQLQKALNPLMKSGGDWLSDVIGGAAKYFLGGSGGGTNGYASSVFQGTTGIADAMGAVYGPSWKGRLKYFAMGGVVNGPTGFMHSGGPGIMGEAGAEAIMPLQRDASGKLGVGTAPVSIEINNYSGANISQTESVDPNGNKRISILVEKAVEDGLATGRFDKTMRNSFGLARQGR